MLLSPISFHCTRTPQFFRAPYSIAQNGSFCQSTVHMQVHHQRRFCSYLLNRIINSDFKSQCSFSAPISPTFYFYRLFHNLFCSLFLQIVTGSCHTATCRTTDCTVTSVAPFYASVFLCKPQLNTGSHYRLFRIEATFPRPVRRRISVSSALLL